MITVYCDSTKRKKTFNFSQYLHTLDGTLETVPRNTLWESLVCTVPTTGPFRCRHSTPVDRQTPFLFRHETRDTRNGPHFNTPQVLVITRHPPPSLDIDVPGKKNLRKNVLENEFSTCKTRKNVLQNKKNVDDLSV